MKSLLLCPNKNPAKIAPFLSSDIAPFMSLGTLLGNRPLCLPSSDDVFVRSFSFQRRELSCVPSRPSWRKALCAVCLSGRSGNVNGVPGVPFSTGVSIPAPLQRRKY